MEKNKKEEFKILGFSIWRIFAYFIIYSIVGYLLETIFGIVTKGVIESRKSFLYGPFCAIYGVGAAIMIIFLQFFNKNNNSLFFRRIYNRFNSRIHSKLGWRVNITCKMVGLFINST